MSPWNTNPKNNNFQKIKLEKVSNSIIKKKEINKKKSELEVNIKSKSKKPLYIIIIIIILLIYIGLKLFF